MEQKQEIQPLGVGTQVFQTLIRTGNVYVDKTDLIHQLLDVPSESVFLARPRRFGKTLLLDSIQEIFYG
jgi:hypothetical protein